MLTRSLLSLEDFAVNLPSTTLTIFKTLVIESFSKVPFDIPALLLAILNATKHEKMKAISLKFVQLRSGSLSNYTEPLSLVDPYHLRY